MPLSFFLKRLIFSARHFCTRNLKPTKVLTASTIGTLDFTEGWNFNNFKMSVSKKNNPAKTASKEEEERLK